MTGKLIVTTERAAGQSPRFPRLNKHGNSPASRKRQTRCEGTGQIGVNSMPGASRISFARCPRVLRRLHPTLPNALDG